MAADKKKLLYYRESTHTILNVIPPYSKRYVSTQLLNTLTLLACTQSVDNVFNTLMVIWENDNFLTYKSTLFLHQHEIVLSC